MTRKLVTDAFLFEYRESEIDHTVLWESHCHAQFEMIAVLEGDVSVMLEGRVYRLIEHQVVVIPPLCYHTITANKKGAYRRVTVLFDRSAIPEVLCPRFLSPETEVAVTRFPQIEELRQICLEESAFYAPLAESLMICILYGIAQSKETHAEKESDAFLEVVIRYIDAHLSEKILLEDLARCTSRSKSSVSHLFEEKMNVSPKQYVIQKKLAYAERLIRDGMPPTAAAVQIGYENYSDFYRMYRKHFGKNPTQGK